MKKSERNLPALRPWKQQHSLKEILILIKASLLK
jgi:hypothetical protein